MFKNEMCYFVCQFKGQNSRARERPKLNSLGEALELQGDLCNLGPQHESSLRGQAK